MQGRRRDFKLFKTSKMRLRPETRGVAGSGNQGLRKRHAKTGMPKKARQKEFLVRERQAKKPRHLQRTRLLRDHHCHAKFFKIIADRYRNRRRRFSLRFFRITAINNMELDAA